MVEAAAQTMVILEILHKSQLCQVYTAPVSLCYRSKLVTLSVYYLGKAVHGQQTADSFPQPDWETVSCKTAENTFPGTCVGVSPVRWTHICFCLMTVSSLFVIMVIQLLLPVCDGVRGGRPAAGVILDYWITDIQLSGPVLAAAALHRLCRAVTVCSLGQH